MGTTEEEVANEAQEVKELEDAQRITDLKF
jgi:hypothetical protein